MMIATSPAFGAALLVAAGIYQLTPLKLACLQHCRAPAHFLARHWRPGPGGALRLRFKHGLFCLGCCWILMELLFLGGVMNLLWIVTITLFVLLEKVIPFGPQGGRVTGTTKEPTDLESKEDQVQGIKVIVALGAAVGVMLGAALVSAQDTVTEADYEGAMKELRYLVTDAAMHIDASYFGDLGEDSDKLYTQFSKVETFWKEQGQAKAVEIAGQALAAVSGISRASGTQDGPAATAALADLRKACDACHGEFREETADGFRIKPSALK